MSKQLQSGYRVKKPVDNIKEIRAQRISNPSGKRLYTLKEAAQYLGRSEWGMRSLAWAGRVPVVRNEGGRKLFFDIRDLDAFIENSKSIYE